MKPNYFLKILIVLLIVFLFNGYATAFNQPEASISIDGLSQPVHPRDSITVIVTFTSNSDEPLRILQIGIHFDWMGPNEFYRKDFSANPITVLNGETRSFEYFVVIHPKALGTQNCYVAVDGVKGSSAFAWDFPTQTIQVIPKNTPPATPTTTASPTQIPDTPTSIPENTPTLPTDTLQGQNVNGGDWTLIIVALIMALTVVAVVFLIKQKI